MTLWWVGMQVDNTTIQHTAYIVLWEKEKGSLVSALRNLNRQQRLLQRLPMLGKPTSRCWTQWQISRQERVWGRFLLVEIGNVILKCIWEGKTPTMAKFEKEKQNWRLWAAWLKNWLSYGTKLQKSRQCGTGKRVREKQNGIENPETDPHIYGQLILDKGEKAT